MPEFSIFEIFEAWTIPASPERKMAVRCIVSAALWMLSTYISIVLGAAFVFVAEGLMLRGDAVSNHSVVGIWCYAFSLLAIALVSLGMMVRSLWPMLTGRIQKAAPKDIS